MKIDKNIKRKFVIGKAPFIRRADFGIINTKNIMYNFLLSLIPIIIFAWYVNGINPFLKDEVQTFKMLYPLVFVLCAGLSSYLIESLYYLLILKEEGCFKKAWDNYAVIPGVLLAMILPLTCPIWVLLIGVVFAIVVVKMLFGGFSHNIFNPALLAYIFVMLAFYDVIVNNSMIDIEIISSATPLTELKSLIKKDLSIGGIVNNNGGLLKMFLYNQGRSIAESSPILCLCTYLFLSIKKVIDYRNSLLYLLVIFAFSYFVAIFLSVDKPVIFSLFNILNGGVIFASVFMITEPVTSPRNYIAKYIYIIFIAIFTLFLRFVGDLPDGVATAILFMNMLAPSLDTFASHLAVDNRKYKKLIYLIVMFLIISLLVAYTIMKLLGE